MLGALALGPRELPDCAEPTTSGSPVGTAVGGLTPGFSLGISPSVIPGAACRQQIELLQK